MQEIDNLQTTVSSMNREASMVSLPEAGQLEEDEEPLWKLAWRGFQRGFTLTYFVRAGLNPPPPPPSSSSY